MSYADWRVRGIESAHGWSAWYCETARPKAGRDGARENDVPLRSVSEKIY